MTKVKLTNFTDMQMAERGLIPREGVRHVEIEALADTGAIAMAIPEDVAEKLGAPSCAMTPSASPTAASSRSITWAPLWIEVLGRGMTGDAIVLPRGTTPLLGAVQLEMMDLVVVPATGEVITNPGPPGRSDPADAVRGVAQRQLAHQDENFSRKTSEVPPWPKARGSSIAGGVNPEIGTVGIWECE